MSPTRYIFSKIRALNQVHLWKQELPKIVAHYAVKCNNDQRLLSWLHKEGVHFDCASPREMVQVLNTGASPSNIIYANPCKSIRDICEAENLKIKMTVVDSPEEVEKLAVAGWTGSTLIRLMVPDLGSEQPFSKKFGAPADWVPDILKTLASKGIEHSGWSFHVGSLCK